MVAAPECQATRTEIADAIIAGGVAERFKAPVLKTGVGQLTVGSNPTPSAITPSSSTCFLGPLVDDWPDLASLDGHCRAQDGVNLSRSAPLFSATMMEGSV